MIFHMIVIVTFIIGSISDYVAVLQLLVNCFALVSISTPSCHHLSFACSVPMVYLGLAHRGFVKLQ